MRHRLDRYETIMWRRLNDEIMDRWRRAARRISLRQPLRLRLARHLYTVAIPAPFAAVAVFDPPGDVLPFALLGAALLSARMVLHAVGTRGLPRYALLHERLGPLRAAPWLLLVASPVGGWLAARWADVPALTGTTGAVLLGAASVAALALAALAALVLAARSPRVPARGSAVPFRVSGALTGAGSSLFLLSAVCHPDRDLLLPTLAVLAVDLAARALALRAPRALRWRAHLAALLAMPADARDDAVVAWAHDAVLTRPAAPDYRLVAALVHNAWHEYGGALTAPLPDLRVSAWLSEGSERSLRWLVEADEALLAVENFAGLCEPRFRARLLREHLAASVLVDATLALAWGLEEHGENAYTTARSAATGCHLLGSPEWAAHLRVAAAAVSAHRAENPNRAAADLRALLSERLAADQPLPGPVARNAHLLTVLLARHVGMREAADELTVLRTGLAGRGREELPALFDGWAKAALWQAGVHDLVRYEAKGELEELLTSFSPFTGLRAEDRPRDGGHAPLAEDPPAVRELVRRARDDPWLPTRRALAVLTTITEHFGSDQPFTERERLRMAAEEAAISMGEVAMFQDALVRELRGQLRPPRGSTAAGADPAPDAAAGPGASPEPAEPGDAPEPADAMPLGLASLHARAAGVLRFVARENDDPDTGLRKAFSYSEDVRARRLSSELATRDDGGARRAPAPFRHVNPLRRHSDLLSDEARSLAHTGTEGAAKVNRRRGLLDFAQIHRLLADADAGARDRAGAPGRRTLLVSYWHDPDETLLFLLRADRPAPVLVTVPHTPAERAALHQALLRVTLPKVRRLVDQPWDAAFRPLVEAIAQHSDPGDQVWIVPDGVLHHVPLHAVALPDGRPLLERNPVCFTPSASIMRFCLGAEPPAPPVTGLFVADRTTDSPLPFARLEARVGASQLPQAVTAADRAELVRLLNERPFDVLHLACHGTFVPNAPELSAVLLGPGERLTAHDLLRQRIRVGVVTIGACESGLGELDLSAERIGLVRAFVQAGASCVVASLWPVHDLATSILTEHLYAGLRAGRTRAEALGAAQLRLRTTTAGQAARFARQRRALLTEPAALGLLDGVLAHLATLPPDRAVYADPIHWAAFQLYGDWR